MPDAPGVGEGQPVSAPKTSEVTTTESPWKEIYRPRKAPEQPKGLTIQEIRAKREAITEAELSVTLVKEKLAKVQVPVRDRKNFFNAEEGRKAAQESREELERCLHRIRRLPETLTFEHGITLIVGENGAGKTTLAKAIMYAALYQNYIEEGDTPEEARVLVFELSESVRSTSDLERVQAGMAPLIAQAMNVTQLASGSGFGDYYEVPNLIGWQRTRDVSNEYDFRENQDFRSHRQTVDYQLIDWLKQRKEKGAKPSVVFIDEPETGMSPKRHLKLEKEIGDVVPEKSIVIVPTNSVVLYASDLPRIDLDFPERGIHRPSQFTVDKQL